MFTFKVGLVVMPFSATYEGMEQAWVFGEVWCEVSIMMLMLTMIMVIMMMLVVMMLGGELFPFTHFQVWHSLDVLASTASILHLCVISLDRSAN